MEYLKIETQLTNEQVFITTPQDFRLPEPLKMDCGRVLKEEFARFDASKLYSAGDAVFEEDPDCRCGEIISGAALPSSCPLFGNRCTPENPVGACMASSEGSCAASFMYGGSL